MDEPEKLDLRSHDIAEDKKQELLRLFPEILTEGGKIDLERLKLALGETVDVGKERYGMNWPGKADCFKAIQAPSLGTLRPCQKESVNFDTTQNLIIEGDNLEVLKLLQKSYMGKIKVIYIDPPYNTGNDFIYPDNYTESLQTYLEYTGQVDSHGKKFNTNTEADGRFHSKWLNMMYPRLYLARNLLREDGVIFISIDDREVENLRKICNEVFGEENFVGVIIVQANKRGQTYKEISKTHEYLLLYSMEAELELNELEKPDEALPYKDSKGPFDLWELRNRNPKFGRFNRPNLFFPIYISPSLTDENGYSKISLKKDSSHSIEVVPLNSEGTESCWRWSPGKISKTDLVIATPQLVAKQTRDGKWNVYEKSRKSTTKVKSLWTDTDVISEQGTLQIGELGLADSFEHPKPTGLISRCIQIAANQEDLILDFFSGSGTTAQAVLELNKQEESNLNFILVQLPEPTGREDYPTIPEICKERVRRVIKKLNDATEGKLRVEGKQKQDRGFRVFKLAESNFKTWNADLPSGNVAALKEQLELHINHIRDARTPEDILYEILLKSGFPLTTPLEKLTMEGKTVFSAAGRALFICLERELTMELIRAMAEQKPERVVCLDEGFAGNDQLKANAVQIFKNKGVTSFKTV
jgi:adenine-specific DNA-methyltransferase